jgi:hypothetical protein
MISTLSPLTIRQGIRRSCPSDLPFDILDAHFLAGLLIVVEPVALGQVDVRELSPGLNSCCLPCAL